MSNTTTALWHMPNTPIDALAHLVRHHGWTPETPLADTVQAHRFAHGIDGRPDLADPDLEHAHSAAAAGWQAPVSPPPPGGWSEPAGKPKIGRYIVGVVVLFFIGAGIVGAAGSGAGSGIGDVVGVSTHTVTYKVEGTTSQASITYQNANGDTSQQSDVDVPLTMKGDGSRGLTLNGMRRGEFLYISAQNSEDSGSVTCAIEVDGVRVEENTSRGGYTIATCSGRL